MRSSPRQALAGCEPRSPAAPQPHAVLRPLPWLHRPPVFTAPQCSLPGGRATSTMQKMLYGKTAAVTRWVLC